MAKTITNAFRLTIDLDKWASVTNSNGEPITVELLAKVLDHAGRYLAKEYGLATPVADLPQRYMRLPKITRTFLIGSMGPFEIHEDE